MSEEATLYSDGKVVVTAGRLVADGMTHALATVAAVSVTEETPDLRLPVIGMAVGVVIIVIGLLASRTGGGGMNVITLVAFGSLGLLVLGAGAWAWRLAKPRYTLHFRIPTGRKPVFSDTDRARMDRIVAAVKKALAKKR